MSYLTKLILLTLLTQLPLVAVGKVNNEDINCQTNKLKQVDKQSNIRAALLFHKCKQQKTGLITNKRKSTNELSNVKMFGGSDLNMITVDEVFPAVTQAGSVVWGNESTVVTVYNDTTGAPDSFSGMSVSTDGGITFEQLSPNPFDAVFTNDSGSPAVAYDENASKWLALTISEDCGDQSIGLMSSPTPEIPNSWVAESCVHVGLADDRPMLWVDNNVNSPFYGRRYISYNDFNAMASLKVLWYDSNQDTWNDAVVAAGSQNQNTMEFIFKRNVNVSGDIDGVNGYVYIFAMDEAGGAGSNPLNWVYRSEDGGVTWTGIQYGSGFPAVGVGLCAGSDYFFMIPPNWRHMGWGQGAVGPGGVLHYVFSRGSQTPEDYGDVFYTRSVNNGDSWSTPIHLNTDQDNKNNVIQWQPSISVTAQGLVLAAWYDRRSTTDGLNYQYYGRLSLDNGISWQPDEPISDMISPQPTQFDPLKSICFAGDSNIHNTLSNDALVTWTDGRNLTPDGTEIEGEPVLQSQMDVYFKRVPLCPNITISPNGLPNGEETTLYSEILSGSGGTGPYTFELSGLLPDGLSLDGMTGEISGVPTNHGNSLFSIIATDSYGCSGSEGFGIIINPDPINNCPVITLDPLVLPDGQQGAPEIQQVTASGGVGDYTYMITEGSLPTGISLDPITGEISGVPQESGFFDFNITATDSNGCTGTHNYTNTVACPMITLSPSTQLPDATASFPYLTNITANGGTEPYKFYPQSATPQGIYYSEGGTIFGVAEKGGSKITTIAVEDVNGCTGSKNFRLDSTNCPNGAFFCDKTIDLTGDPLADPPVEPNFTTNDVCGSSVTQWFETQSCPSSDDIGHTPSAHTHWGFAIPDGMGGFTEDCSSYGDGTPSQNVLQTQIFDVSQCNSGEVLLDFNYLISFEEDSTFDRFRVFVKADGGPNEVVADNGPGGPVCNGQGSPGLSNLKLWSGWQHFSLRHPATSTFQAKFVAETENGNNAGEGVFIDDVMIKCQCPADFIMFPESLPFAIQDEAYDVVISTEGGQPDITFGLPPSSDPIPPGLSLDSVTGSITGIPTTSGIYPFRLEATDANACQIFTDYNLVVSPPNCPVINYSLDTLDDGQEGVFYSASLDAMGGVESYTYAVSEGELPPGMSLNVDTGVISGTPTTPGSYPFTVTVLDNLLCNTSADFNINISPAGCPNITVSPSELPNPDLFENYNEFVIASGGVANYNYSITNGVLPEGISLNTVSGQISGNASSGGMFDFKVTAQDVNGCFGSENYSFFVTLPDLIFKHGFEPLPDLIFEDGFESLNP